MRGHGIGGGINEVYLRRGSSSTAFAIPSRERKAPSPRELSAKLTEGVSLRRGFAAPPPSKREAFWLPRGEAVSEAD